MADHDTHDHTGVPGVSTGAVATDSVWDAAGDLVQGTGANTAAKLSAGSSGKVLTSNGAAAALTWETPSSGIARSTLGTTSVGASFATRGMYIKKITLASAGLLASINAHMKGNGTNKPAVTGVLYSDSAGSPINLMCSTHTVITDTPVMDFAMNINTTARWLTFPVGVWLAAGDYWIGIFLNDATGTANSLAYSSGTGSDRTVAGGTVNQPCDSSIQAISAGTNDYSIYADILR